MAQFRLEVKIHKRGTNGSGIMQKACYNARESLYDDEIGLRTKIPSKSKVEELCFKQIFLLWSSKLFRPLLSRLNNLMRKLINLFQGARSQVHKQSSYAPACN